jgi:hypothetical protein
MGSWNLTPPKTVDDDIPDGSPIIQLNIFPFAYNLHSQDLPSDIVKVLQAAGLSCWAVNGLERLTYRAHEETSHNTPVVAGWDRICRTSNTSICVDITCVHDRAYYEYYQEQSGHLGGHCLVGWFKF